MEKYSKILIGTAVAGVLAGGLWWSSNAVESDTDVITRRGMHWHPELAVYVRGERQIIPADIGIGTQYAGFPGYDGAMGMAGVHTHDATGVIHFEFSGLVREKDLTLGEFFRVWGKDMRAFGSNVRMTVNGKESVEYENYMMRDGDKIELRYE